MLLQYIYLFSNCADSTDPVSQESGISVDDLPAKDTQSGKGLLSFKSKVAPLEEPYKPRREEERKGNNGRPLSATGPRIEEGGALFISPARPLSAMSKAAALDKKLTALFQVKPSTDDEGHNAEPSIPQGTSSEHQEKEKYREEEGVRSIALPPSVRLPHQPEYELPMVSDSELILTPSSLMSQGRPVSGGNRPFSVGDRRVSISSSLRSSSFDLETDHKGSVTMGCQVPGQEDDLPTVLYSSSSGGLDNLGYVPENDSFDETVM